MLRLETVPDLGRKVLLGQIIELRFVKSDPEIEVRVHLQHRPILYTEPLREWSAEPSLLIFPEAPGTYTLHVQWRSSGGEGGTEKLDFTIVAAEDVSPEPARFPLRSGSEIWVPNAWEAGGMRKSERPTAEILETIVKPGMVVYDLGANVGFYTSLMSRLAGPEGHVYGFEPNPICLQFLRTNILLQELDNVDVLPVAVLDQAGRTRFCLNYGNSNLGLSEASGHFAAKAGHIVEVPCFELDHLIGRFSLRRPNLIKVDVEGVEHLAVRGMTRTLKDHRPVLLLEFHGEGPAARTLEQLDELGYHYRVPLSDEELTSAEAVARIGDSVVNLLATP